MEGECGEMIAKDLSVHHVGQKVRITADGAEVAGRLKGLEVKLAGTSRIGSLQGGAVREAHYYEITATIGRHIIALEGGESVEIINVNGMEGAA